MSLMWMRLYINHDISRKRQQMALYSHSTGICSFINTSAEVELSLLGCFRDSNQFFSHMTFCHQSTSSEFSEKVKYFSPKKSKKSISFSVEKCNWNRLKKWLNFYLTSMLAIWRDCVVVLNVEYWNNLIIWIWFSARHLKVCVFLYRFLYRFGSSFSINFVCFSQTKFENQENNVYFGKNEHLKSFFRSFFVC